MWYLYRSLSTALVASNSTLIISLPLCNLLFTVPCVTIPLPSRKFLRSRALLSPRMFPLCSSSEQSGFCGTFSDYGFSINGSQSRVNSSLDCPLPVFWPVPPSPSGRYPGTVPPPVSFSSDRLRSCRSRFHRPQCIVPVSITS